MKRSRRTTSKQHHRGTSLLRLIILASAVIVLLFLAGIAITAQASSGPSRLQLKQQLFQRQTQYIATARAKAPPKNVSNIQRPAQAAITPRAGLTQTHQGPFPSSFFLVQSLWQGPVGTDWTLAYAGAKPKPDGTIQQGAVLLYTVTRGSLNVASLHPIGTFLAPGTTTQLSIVSVNGSVLLLQSGSGSHLTFNLQTHQYGP